MNPFETTKQHIQQILNHATAAVDPFSAIKRTFSRSGETLQVHTAKSTRRYLLKAYKQIWVVGCGKAGTPMSLAIEELVGDRISGGIVVVKDGYTSPGKPNKISIVEASHPEPDERGMLACRDIIEVLKKADANHLVIALISGGGSALWPQPSGRITLAEKQTLTKKLLASGANINDMNVIRKHLSMIKGGQAARYAYPADVIVAVVSDVIDDDLAIVASGPFSPDSSTFAEAYMLINKHRLHSSMPQSVSEVLQIGMQSKFEDTPKPGDKVFQKVTHVMCASNRIAIEAAAEKAHSLGYDPLIITPPVTGPCREAAQEFCARLRELQQRTRGKSRCVIAGGETTVELGKRFGKGGRNQEFSLAAAFLLQDTERVVVASYGTDGTDGPTDAAGAMVDHTTVRRASEVGLDASAALNEHNAYPLFEKLGDLIITGPTNTNVMDIQIGIVDG